MAIENYIVLPTKKFSKELLPSSEVTLHRMDIAIPAIQIHNHRFYKRPESLSAIEVVERLKSSFAEALELYPPVAATQRINEDGTITLLMDTPQGMPFIVDHRDTPYVGDSFDLNPRLDHCLVPGATSIAVKITLYSCGVVAVATSISHQVTDLCSFLDFQATWCQISRGDPVDWKRIPVDWSRNPAEYFKGLADNGPIYSAPPFKVVSFPRKGPRPSMMAPCVFTRWILSAGDLERLKLDLSPPASTGLWISLGDAINALVCGSVTRARQQSNIPRLLGRSTEESQVEIVAMAADGRFRAPLGNMGNGQYFGNFYNLIGSALPRADLLSPTIEAAASIALAIRNDVNNLLSPKAIANRIEFFNQPENNQAPNRVAWTSDIIISNWCMFDIKGPQFDCGWGKPFKATSGGNTFYTPAYAIIIHDKDTGNVHLQLTVETDGGTALQSDPLLNKYAVLEEKNLSKPFQ
eukprot:gene6107-7074_t